MPLDRALRPFRYFVIGLAGGLLGVVLARTIFHTPLGFWPALVFAGLSCILGILRDRALRRRSKAADPAPPR